MRKRTKKEIRTNHERYLVTYSDLITLLLVFFIVLYAMSDVNKEKYSNLASSLQGIFQQQADELSITRAQMDQHVNITPDELRMMKAVKEQQYLRELKRKIDQQIKEKGLGNDIQTSLYEAGLKIILTDAILFPSGSADLKNESKTIIQDIASLITGVENPIKINGYTDNVPINNTVYPSNWELSSARAISVLKEMLIRTPKVKPQQYSATGYGEYHPIESNLTEKGREKNRRVEIIIERQFGDGLIK